MDIEKVPSFIKIFCDCKKRIPRQTSFLKGSLEEKNVNSKTRALSWAHGCCFLATLKGTDAVVSNAKLPRHTMSQELFATGQRIKAFHTAKYLLRQSLNVQDTRHMKLKGCLKVKTLFSESIATSIILEQLSIIECHELKHIMTNEGQDGDYIRCNNSIFPKLEMLRIRNCNKLEILFPSTLSGVLQKLKSMDIRTAHELKYIFGKKYNHEDYTSPNENENNEPHFHLPALETLSHEDVPNMNSICIKSFQLDCPSQQTLKAEKELLASMKGIETFHSTECLVRKPVMFQNIRQMTLSNCLTLKTMFSVSIAMIITLEKLEIWDCEKLKHIITNRGEDRDYINCTSIFPKLKILRIKNCNMLEFIFPSIFSGGLQKLKLIAIQNANELKYVFGKYNHEHYYVPNENENDELHIHLLLWKHYPLKTCQT
ncbi:uncharacterized protein LOC129318991 [Prosopis cineraria]|uniref:uncharacterized protein LOC129318991 n=1 Tax=Prosopis cineraria TaxID=364024 RepID=UPI0024108921|nr:uncharacterized protein LOC129318991 [Prosopis cineraria]XP_054819994.1 uncharacterized protein LOC129318991 [Prosopis cineraria]XP_054819995.1 uncharacterized protein LOC129318991 [Prosopis cineraria]XP_054819996.1 uncharacterized protein LOC129318991 [Prosopis cineraria]XP_054819997.1 uncharacterized protein LOC129318991 [Prosopis cineraria]XP_054819998.1 uncharacterized protein LOC129318991 [Prosopis cineraria]